MNKRVRHPVDIWPENLDKIKELLPPRMTITYWVNKCIQDSIEENTQKHEWDRALSAVLNDPYNYPNQSKGDKK